VFLDSVDPSAYLFYGHEYGVDNLRFLSFIAGETPFGREIRD